MTSIQVNNIAILVILMTLLYRVREKHEQNTIIRCRNRFYVLKYRFSQSRAPCLINVTKGLGSRGRGQGEGVKGHESDVPAMFLLYLGSRYFTSVLFATQKAVRDYTHFL